MLGLYVKSASWCTAVTAPLVISPKYICSSALVVVSLVVVAPAAAQLSVPAASLTSAKPLVAASAAGSVQVTLLATVAGAWKAIQYYCLHLQNASHFV